MKLLLDHNLSPKLARALQAIFDEHTIVSLRDRFKNGTSDEAWISATGTSPGGLSLADLEVQMQALKEG